MVILGWIFNSAHLLVTHSSSFLLSLVCQCFNVYPWVSGLPLLCTEVPFRLLRCLGEATLLAVTHFRSSLRILPTVSHILHFAPSLIGLHSTAEQMMARLPPLSAFLCSVWLKISANMRTEGSRISPVGGCQIYQSVSLSFDVTTAWATY